jgi:hypothetical protein
MTYAVRVHVSLRHERITVAILDGREGKNCDFSCRLFRVEIRNLRLVGIRPCVFTVTGPSIGFTKNPPCVPWLEIKYLWSPLTFTISKKVFFRLSETDTGSGHLPAFCQIIQRLRTASQRVAFLSEMSGRLSCAASRPQDRRYSGIILFKTLQAYSANVYLASAVSGVCVERIRTGREFTRGEITRDR